MAERKSKHNQRNENALPYVIQMIQMDSSYIAYWIVAQSPITHSSCLLFIQLFAVESIEIIDSIQLIKKKQHVLQTNCQSLIERLLEWTLTSSLKYNLIYMKHKCILLVKCPLYEIYVIIKTFLFSFLSQSWKMLYITVA